MTSLQEIQKHLRELAEPARAEKARRFMKSGKGEYAEGDRFLGIRVPDLRQQVKKYRGVSLDTIQSLLDSPFNEERMFALLLLVDQFTRSDSRSQKTIYEFYLSNTNRINNWNLVDCSAYLILGPYLEEKIRKPLFRLAKSTDFWERRISIIATFHFIRNDDFGDALKISDILKDDPEDLIQKAVGWMLREIGNRDRGAEQDFLQTRYLNMPRTMLRYAIEKFPDKIRRQYLAGTI